MLLITSIDALYSLLFVSAELLGLFWDKEKSSTTKPDFALSRILSCSACDSKRDKATASSILLTLSSILPISRMV